MRTCKKLLWFQNASFKCFHWPIPRLGLATAPYWQIEFPPTLGLQLMANCKTIHICIPWVYPEVDRSQSLFNFVPQEKGLIWRPPSPGAGKIWKNQFCAEKCTNRVQKRPKVGGHMPRSHGNLSDFVFVHYSGRSSHFSEGHRSVCPRKY